MPGQVDAESDRGRALAATHRQRRVRVGAQRLMPGPVRAVKLQAEQPALALNQWRARLERREQFFAGLRDRAVEVVRGRPRRDRAGDQLARSRVVQLHVQFVLGTELEQLAADDHVRADAPPGVDLAFAFTVGQVLPARLQQHEHVLAGDHLHRRQDFLCRRAHLVGEIRCVDPLGRRHLIAELEYRYHLRLRRQQERENHPLGLSPKIAVPTRTMVAPSSMAAS